MNIWAEDGLKHITPRGIEWPEGFDVLALLSQLAGDGRVLEIGCGRGRLAPAFDASGYFGVDINYKALEMAARDCPGYRFGTTAPAEPFDLTLLYTVALHVRGFPFEFTSPRVVIAEIMRPGLARPLGIPPAYNRAPSWYVDRMAEQGYRLDREMLCPYAYYPGEKITFLEFTKC